ncbi:MAG: hypothetical protein U0457_21210 [Candidatus Sericytochromatia bacterium]
MIDKAPLIGSVAQGFGTTPPEVKYAETDAGLKDAAKDFTSILFSYMFSTMRGNPDDNNDDQEHGFGGGMFSGENLDMFIGFLDQEVGKKFASQGAQDIVDTLYKQLKGENVFKDERKKVEDKQKESLENKIKDEIKIQNKL